MQDLLRQPTDVEPSSDVIRVKVATDRAPVASRLLRFLKHAGCIEIVACSGPDDEAPACDRGQSPAVLVLDCGAFTLTRRDALQVQARSHFPARVLWLLDDPPHGTDEVRSILDAVKNGCCHGIVTSDCQAAILIRAITVVARHDYWLPRALLGRALHESQALRPGVTARAINRREADRPTRLLTRRERQILHQVWRGLTNKEVGHQLGIGEDTVKKHLRNMYAKLGVHRRTQMLLRSVAEARDSS